MTFNTPAFVRVEDAEKRKELIEWLGSVGYIRHINTLRLAENPYSPTVYIGVENRCGIGVCFAFSLDYPLKIDLYDCGDNVGLFKALAAMNDENDCEQWFVREKAGKICAWFKCINTFIGSHIGGWRKATSAEIIEYFKTKQP